MGGFGLEPWEGGHLKPARLVPQPLPHTDVWDCVCVKPAACWVHPSRLSASVVRVWGMEFSAVFSSIGEAALASVSQCCVLWWREGPGCL